MKNYLTRLHKFIITYPILACLIGLNIIGLVAVGYHYYSIKIANDTKARKNYNTDLTGMMPVLYPSEFTKLNNAKHIFYLNYRYSTDANPSDADINWIVSKFQAPKGVRGSNLYNRYVYLINTLIYASFHMSDSQRLVVKPYAVAALKVLPKGDGHIATINCALLLANMQDSQDIPILKSLLSNYTYSQDRTRIQRAITCIAEKKLDYGP